jgi:hypothetical protein
METAYVRGRGAPFLGAPKLRGPPAASGVFSGEKKRRGPRPEADGRSIRSRSSAVYGLPKIGAPLHAVASARIPRVNPSGRRMNSSARISLTVAGLRFVISMVRFAQPSPSLNCGGRVGNCRIGPKHVPQPSVAHRLRQCIGLCRIGNPHGLRQISR